MLKKILFILLCTILITGCVNERNEENNSEKEENIVEKEYAGTFYTFNKDELMLDEDYDISDCYITNDVITKEDNEKIEKGLLEILEELESGVLEIDKNAEDIHMFVEAKLTEKIGDSGKKVHTARSRNDQVALDLKMYVKEEIIEIKKLIKILINSLIKKAEENLETVMPGYTHMQRAQPVTFAHHLMAYTQMLKRDYIRLENCFELMEDSAIKKWPGVDRTTV